MGISYSYFTLVNIYVYVYISVKFYVTFNLTFTSMGILELSSTFMGIFS